MFPGKGVVLILVLGCFVGYGGTCVGSVSYYYNTHKASEDKSEGHPPGPPPHYMIPDPNFSIPDHGSRVKKIPDPGSASKNLSIFKP